MSHKYSDFAKRQLLTNVISTKWKKSNNFLCSDIVSTAADLIAQNSTIDSLRLEHAGTGQDTSRIRLLNVLFNEFRYIDFTLKDRTES